MDEYRDLGTFDGLSGFEGAIGKLTRARHQLRDLNQRFIRYAESRPYRTVERVEQRPGETIADYRYIVELVSEPKREWGVLIGEVIHNMRSALDHTIYATAQRPSRKNQFPIYTSRRGWDSQAGRMLRSVPLHVAEFVESRQPFQASGTERPDQHMLAILNRLSNHDKHRLLHTAITTLHSVSSPSVTMVRDVSAIHDVEFTMGPLRVGADLARFTITPDGPNPELNLKGEFALGVAFTDPLGRDRVIEGAEVLPLLLAVYRFTWDTCVRIEAAITDDDPSVLTP